MNVTKRKVKSTLAFLTLTLLIVASLTGCGGNANRPTHFMEGEIVDFWVNYRRESGRTRSTPPTIIISVAGYYDTVTSQHRFRIPTTPRYSSALEIPPIGSFVRVGVSRVSNAWTLQTIYALDLNPTTEYPVPRSPFSTVAVSIVTSFITTIVVLYLVASRRKPVTNQQLQ